MAAPTTASTFTRMEDATSEELAVVISEAQIHLNDNTWDIGKNYFAEVAILGGIKTTLELLNALIRKNPPPAAKQRNDTLRRLDTNRRQAWAAYLATAKTKDEIWAVVMRQVRWPRTA